MMEIGLEDPEGLEYLKSEVRKLLGFDCRKYNDKFLKRRFDIRVRKNRLDSYQKYVQLLKTDTNECEELRKELTIHVTNFFRDKSFWTEFMQEIIPELTKDQPSVNNSIGIWSAGCSSGEEPVSITISLLETPGMNRRFSVLATDYDEEIIKKAKKALYEETQFKETEAYIRKKYFTQTRDGLYTPCPEVQSHITYRREDMLSTMPSNVDVIFCRNVVIYFDREAKNELYRRFFEALRPGGFLILGKTEYLSDARDKFDIVDTRERIYRKAAK